MLEPLNTTTVAHLHPAAATCVFWELEADVASKVTSSGDPRFEKEAWLSAVLMQQQCCGFHILREGHQQAIASIMFCEPRFAPGAAQMPTAPISADAWLLTSLHIDEGFAGVGLEAVLIDAVLAHLWQRRATAVEAFGLGAHEGWDDVTEQAGAIGIVPESVLQAAGFYHVASHPVLPRMRIELPPEHMLSAQAAEELVASALA
ncbi:hypothetical protein [Corynebacterium gerontici]|uniref:N-acetyltransferase domain-containing protein n=1 Tax=Corynebacterium gerontici TaxID=2079234 RepID=A0A3G6J678_9CORY|nr:hypothetical protein [Corynebacterium gerontici]AZA12428.1 hypothetical protein CGERO_10745 [Corynebacterium gerontici]